jgi:hercynine metabolism protein
VSRSWLEELEARLQEQLESFLQANPRQEELLAEQEARERQCSLRQERLALQQRAQATRQRLLELAAEVRCWQQRRDKASAAGAADLATRAGAYLDQLMEQGRRDWQSLAELGQRFAAVEADLDALSKAGGSARSAPPAAATAPAAHPVRDSAATSATSSPPPPDPTVDLEAAWRAFETRLELEELRRRLSS